MPFQIRIGNSFINIISAGDNNGNVYHNQKQKNDDKKPLKKLFDKPHEPDFVV